jgi:DNA-binding response OmpR family regulator
VKLLIVEDENGTSRRLMQYLRREGYRCDLCSDPDRLSTRASAAGYDCIIINGTCPDNVVFQMLRDLKEKGYDGGVIILAGFYTPDATIRSLDAGADDVLSQSVHLGELSARIAALFRRKSFAGNRVVTVHELSIDIPGKIVAVHRKPLHLTRKEFDLLLYLVAHRNAVLSKEIIATNLAEEKDMHGDAEFVAAHVKNLKKKLTAAGCRDCISSVYGMGYKFTI